MIAAAGCTLGILRHLAADITGTAALLHAGGVAFEIMKILGVAYLLSMAWITWQDRSALVIDRDPGSDALPALRIVSSAVLVNLLNPKLTLLLRVPAAVRPRRRQSSAGGDAWAQRVFMAMTFAVFTADGVFAARVRHHLIDRSRIVCRIRQTFAVSFAALSANSQSQPSDPASMHEAIAHQFHRQLHAPRARPVPPERPLGPTVTLKSPPARLMISTLQCMITCGTFHVG